MVRPDLRRRHYELVLDLDPNHRISEAFTKLALAITSEDLEARGNLHAYINNNPNSKRYHPAMYAQFARILVSLGKTVPGWEDDCATR